MRLLMLLISFFLFDSLVTAQPQVIRMSFANPSFEGNLPSFYEGGIVPPEWISCLPGSTPDLQPNAFEVTTLPSDGVTFVGLGCRDNDTYEGLAQNLKSPLQKEVNYCFTVDLAKHTSVIYRISRSALINIWGSDDNCKQKELLWTSPVIDHAAWKKYEVCFTPKEAHSRILFETYYTELPSYRGYVLLDNLSTIEYAVGDEIKFCTGDSLLINAYPTGITAGENWQVTWKANERLKEDLLQNELWVSKPGIYPVELRKANRVYQVNLTVIGEECLSNFVLPNVFTPNGDGINDTFAIQGILPDKWQMQIFNRWGKQVFYSAGYQNNWTGNDQSGKEAQTGLYYYTLKDKESNRQYKGFVQVLK